VRVAFFGSPSFSLPSLRAVAARHEIALVVSQPDKPAGRGLATSRPAVALEAERLGLPLSQPRRLKGNEEFQRELAILGIGVAVTAAFGKILPQRLLEIPAGGFLNVHASLLPLYRGAGPVQWALINGERETGVSIMKTEAGLDTGPVCLVHRTTIGEDERAPELFARLAEIGARAIVEALAKMEQGELECVPQDDGAATLAPLLRKEDGDIDWNESATAIYNRFRGVAAWPGSRFEYGAKPVRVLDMAPGQGSGNPGEILRLTAQGVTVAAGSGAIELVQVQPAGKSAMSARAWANGYRVSPGMCLA
jgi:methionyl-tRNA formyltransferase